MSTAQVSSGTSFSVASGANTCERFPVYGSTTSRLRCGALAASSLKVASAWERRRGGGGRAELAKSVGAEPRARPPRTRLQCGWETWKQATSYCETEFGLVEFCGCSPA